MKCYQKYQMEIAESKVMGSIERGDALGLKSRNVLRDRCLEVVG